MPFSFRDSRQIDVDTFHLAMWDGPASGLGTCHWKGYPGYSAFGGRSSDIADDENDFILR
jgi:hypothetical protein